MTLKNKIKAILAGQLFVLSKADIQKWANYTLNLEGEVKRLSLLKAEEVEITIED